MTSSIPTYSEIPCIIVLRVLNTNTDSLPISTSTDVERKFYLYLIESIGERVLSVMP